MSVVFIIENYVDHALEGILRVSKPVSLGYGQLIFHSSKLAVGIIILNFLSVKNLWGVLISFVLPMFLKEMYYLAVARKDISGEIRREYIREWIKGSSAKIYDIAVTEGFTLAPMIMMAYAGGAAVGYFSAVQTISAIVTITLVLNTAMYPALLQNKGKEVAGATIRLMLMFILPFSIYIVALGDIFLGILSPQYIIAYPAVIPATAAFCLSALNENFREIILGLERFDEKAEIPLRKLLRSYIFVAFSAKWAYVILTAALALFIFPQIHDPVLGAEIFAVIILLGHVATILIFAYITFGRLHVSVGKKKVGWYILANFQLFLILYLTIDYVRGSLLLVGILSIATLAEYFLVLSADRECRTLLSKVIKRIFPTLEK